MNIQYPQRDEVEEKCFWNLFHPLFSPMSKETSLGHLNSFANKHLISLLKTDIRLQLSEARMLGKC